MRHVMCALLSQNVRLSDEVLSTAFSECESIVNSWPITKLSDDVNDEGPLTPNHLLLLESNY